MSVSAIIAGGLSGAGKSTVLEKYAGIDRSQYLTVNPDKIKEEMAERGMVPMVEGLSPMEASDLVHEESSYIARQLALLAQADGKNIIWDITMSSQAKTEHRIDELRAAGYRSHSGHLRGDPGGYSGDPGQTAGTGSAKTTIALERDWAAGSFQRRSSEPKPIRSGAA